MRWPGRFEIIEILERIFILDAAHTPLAAKLLAQSLRAYSFQAELVGIFGISSDKDANKILGHFPEKFIRLIATQSTHPRAMDSQSLEKIIVENGLDGDSSENSKAALEKVMGISKKRHPILVFGSVFLVEEFRKLLMKTK